MTIKKRTTLMILSVACITAVALYMFLMGKDNTTDSSATVVNDQPTIEIAPQVEQPIDIVESRIRLMSALQQAVNTIQSTIWNPITFDVKVIQKQTQIISDGSEQMLTLFPEGSVSEASRAKPEIWSNWQTFKELAEESKRLAQELNESVQGQETDEGTTGVIQNPNAMLMPNTSGNSSLPGMPHIPKIPEIPGSSSTTGNFSAPRAPTLPTLNLPQGTGFATGHINTVSSIRMGKSGNVILPPEITFQRLTSVCVKCHSQFMSANSKNKTDEESTLIK